MLKNCFFNVFIAIIKQSLDGSFVFFVTKCIINTVYSLWIHFISPRFKFSLVLCYIYLLTGRKYYWGSKMVGYSSKRSHFILFYQMLENIFSLLIFFNYFLIFLNTFHFSLCTFWIGTVEQLFIFLENYFLPTMLFLWGFSVRTYF